MFAAMVVIPTNLWYEAIAMIGNIAGIELYHKTGLAQIS